MTIAKGSIHDVQKQSYRQAIEGETKQAVQVENTTPIPISGTFTFAGLLSAKITNFVVASASTEEEHQLTANTRRLLMRSRNGSEMRVAFVSGDTSTKYLTVKRGTVYSEDGLDFSGKVFFQTTLTDVVEIIEWF